jgi:hypothetical protein
VASNISSSNQETFSKMKFTNVFITTTLLTGTTITAESITEQDAPSLATCPKKAEFQACEASKVVLLKACVFANSDAFKVEDIPCFCDINVEIIQECGSMCPEVIKEVDEGGRLDRTKEICPGIDVTPNSGYRAAVSAVVVLAMLLM